jgi:hypothetical protein
MLFIYQAALVLIFGGEFSRVISMLRIEKGEGLNSLEGKQQLRHINFPSAV